MSYSFSIERGDKNYLELENNYRRHYEEMRARLSRDGIDVAPYNPRLKQYFEAFAGGWLINYVVRCDGEPVGHANVYVTNDMHNGEMIASEDVLYVVPEHRNGIGRKLVKFVLSDLAKRGVKRVTVNAVTDLRVAKIWRRMGFKDTAQTMTFTF